MQVQRNGIAAAVAVVIVVVIIVVAAGAYYALSSTGGSTSTGSKTSSSSQSSASHVTSSTTSTVPPSSSSSSAVSTQSSSSSASGQSSTTQASSSTTQQSSSTAQQSSSSTQQSSGSTTTTLSCSSTETVTSETQTTTDFTPQYISLVQSFSSIQFSESDTYNGTQNSATFGYVATSVGGGIYDVNITETSGNSTIPSIVFKVDSNNESVISATVEGFTFYGAEAKSYFDTSMSLYGLQQYYDNELQVFTDSSYFHSTGTTTMTYGSVSFPVTTYEANSLPFTLDECGVDSQVTAYQLEVGTPPGTSLLFITYIHFAGTTNGTSEDVTFQLLSMTVG
ncbi:MAG TPA: hypothetical protein VLY21_02440 [Nitrososphaerales archaeon]|nr:hypothetical protein [Nitrososphaerales archaeon]